jgi:hypothetical protein
MIAMSITVTKCEVHNTGIPRTLLRTELKKQTFYICPVPHWTIWPIFVRIAGRADFVTSVASLIALIIIIQEPQRTVHESLPQYLGKRHMWTHK